MLNQVNAGSRYWAAVAAQVAGVNLFVAIGLLAFPVSQSDLTLGLSYIVGGMWIVLIASVVVFIPPFLRAWRGAQGGVAHSDVDRMIFRLFLIDIAMHTFLVSQEGGLDKSMFLPVFYLIPIAYTLVERRENMRRLFWIYLITIISILLCYGVTWLVTARGWTELPIPVVNIPITNFPDKAPRHYNYALLIVCLTSLLIPMIQMKLIEFLSRKETH